LLGKRKPSCSPKRSRSDGSAGSVETVSQVQYTYKVHSVADWANESALLQIKRVASAVRGEAIADHEMLMLTGNGWQTRDEFQRGRTGGARSAR
jgi:hypothetical protein